MADDDFELEKYKFLFIALALFIGIGLYCFFDLLFLCFGRQTDATISAVDLDRSLSRRGPRNYVTIEWTFKDHSDVDRHGKISHSLDNGEFIPVAVGDSIRVQYLPSWLLTTFDSSRPVRPFGWLFLGIFFASSVGVGWLAWGAITDGQPPPNKKKKR